MCFCRFRVFFTSVNTAFFVKVLQKNRFDLLVVVVVVFCVNCKEVEINTTRECNFQVLTIQLIMIVLLFPIPSIPRT